MRQNIDNFMDAMLSEGKQQNQASRLDDVAEMVSNMEKNLTDKIEQANKLVVDKLASQAGMPNATPEKVEEPESVQEENNDSESINEEE